VRGDSGRLTGHLWRPTGWHGVIGYTFKPWPAQHGVRSLDDDVFASGVLAPFWEAFRPSDGATPPPLRVSPIVTSRSA